MISKDGTEIEVGQQVDIWSSGMLRCHVVEVSEGGLADENGRVQPGHILLQIVIPIKVPRGTEGPVYVVRDAAEKPKDDKVKEFKN